MSRKNTILKEVEVTDYAAEGKALAKLEGKAVFVEGGAVPGDIVDIRLRKNKKDWAEGKVVYFHQYSEERVRPFCEHFSLCGGCKWQMLPYEKQLQYKHQQVLDTLKRIGKVPLPEAQPILGAGKITHYRNKLEFTFSNREYLSEEVIKENEGIKLQRNALGFHIPRFFDKVLDIKTCYLQEEPSNKIRNLIKDYALNKNLPFFDLRAQTGWLRNLIIRICSTGEIMVNICFHYEDKEAREKLMNYLLEQVPEITSLFYTINPKRNDSIYDLQPEIFYGKDHVEEKLGDFYFKIGPKSFFQTNTYQAERLYQTVRDFAGLSGKETIYDLYCGTGSISIFISPKAAKVIGVEVIPEAVEDAKENEKRNNIKNTAFFAGDVVDICDDTFFAQHGKPDIIVTDPPRAGMHEKLLRKLLEIEAPKIVYVSCNPATQARDINILNEKYIVSRLQPVDMFPHTHHIENVALLEKR